MTTDIARTADHAINAGLIANVVLAALKTTVGVFGHSEALLADGVNSTSDVAYYVVVKVFMRFAGRPADRSHPYGHRQLESIAALAVGAFVVSTAIALFWDALNTAFDLATSGVSVSPVRRMALWVSLATVGVKMVLTAYTRRAAGRTGNVAILALARDHRNDIFSSAGASGGILLSQCGFAWGDPAVAAAVAVVVLLTGVQILRDSSAELMDTVPGEALERQTRLLLSRVQGVGAVEEVLAHRFGPYLVLNVTVGVDGAATIAEGDRIASDVERVLSEEIALVKRVYVHCHPAREDPNGGRSG